MISEGVIDGVTLSLGFGLDAVDILLGIILFAGSFAVKLLKLLSTLAPRALIANQTGRKTRVAIIGASFTGCEVSNILKNDKRMQITLINEKEYFEFTPGVLRCFVEPDHFRKIAFQLPRMSPQLLVGYASSISENAVTVQPVRSGVSEETVPFDVCVLALGSSYSGVIRPGKQEPTLHDRARTWQEASKEVKAASTIVVLGAGLVGVELVGEIVCAHPDKTVYLIDRSKEVCKELPARAREYIQSWMNARGVKLLLDTSYKAVDKKGSGWACTLGDDSVIAADLVYRCMGAPPRSEPLRASPLAAALSFNTRGAVAVSDTLQVVGSERVFAGGDVMVHGKTGEVKSGWTAENNGQLIAHNIKRMVEGRELLTYPEGIVGAGKRIPAMCVVSLGKHDGVFEPLQQTLTDVHTAHCTLHPVGDGQVFVLNNFTLCGSIAAIAKWAVEWTLVGKARCRPLATALMGTGESVIKALFSQAQAPRCK